MYALIQLAKNAQKLSIGRVFILTFEDKNLQSLVISLNLDQLRIGMGANEEELPDYSFRSVNQFGKPNGRWRLFDTGETYDSFKVLKVTEEYILEMAELDLHGEDLQDKVFAQSNAEIMGLGGESLSILIEEALPIMREQLLDRLLSN